MKAILTITPQGAISLPDSLRNALGFKTNDRLVAETTSKGLLLRPDSVFPIEMYSDARIQEFNEAEAELAAVLKCSK
ncbi:MAG TPA: AbrB/MazE/SpoVT family DNA-binding domain-containing protein [Chthoniobacterales bacterium]|nr:AbrB/MazE/SpoVT family DNA-binding domain-containing protein [Chthoniobacterales bacterium]